MSGETAGAVRVVLRLEGLCVLIAASIAYSKFGLSWGTFALFFLTPDISLFGYLAGPKVGAISYNLAHSYIGAVACLVAGVVLPAPTILGVGLTWCAHIGFDRALGYGLKYSDGFSFTHLGRIERFPAIMSNTEVNRDSVQ
jgi:hypothetical protein